VTIVGDDARMDAAVKDEDGFFATFLVSSWSPHIVRRAAARRVTPNQVTAVSIGLAVAAAAAFATGVRPGLVIGAVLVQGAFVADCVDGQLARYTGTGTPLGAWLDAVSDRGKELVVYAGLAVGGAQAGEPDIWLLASCALALQALRHQTDFAYAARQGRGPGAPVAEAGRAGGAGRQVGAAGVRTAATLERSWLRWVKRIIVLPIGERFALISITAAVAGPRTTFAALLGWGGVAAVYMGTGRVLRSLADADGPGRLAPATDGTAPGEVGT
jgi:phosphatidylglycerophosphate synthase